jgi:hypothetical protein
MIEIQNVSGRVQVFNLTNKVAPLRRVYPSRTVDREGLVSHGERRVVHPDSITIRAGGSVKVPDGYQTAPEIQKAVAAGRIKISQVPEASKATGRAPAQAAAEAEAMPMPEEAEEAPAGPRTRKSK